MNRHFLMRRLPLAGAIGVGLCALPAHAATYTVSSLGDSGAGSLRQAIQDSNAKSDADTITFASGLKGTITLSSGELEISGPSDSGFRSNLTIKGPGAGALTLSGGGKNRVFRVQDHSTLAVSGLTLSDGYVQGREGEVGVTGGGGGQAEGGAITNAGTLKLSQVILRNNRVVGGEASGRPIKPGSAQDPGGTGGKGLGGAIYNEGVLQMSAVQLLDNQVTGGVGGPGLDGAKGRDVSAGGFGGVAYGGAIYNEGAARLASLVFKGNIAAGGAGGAGGPGSTASTSQPAGVGGDGGYGGDAQGGGVYNAGRLDLVNATLFDNEAVVGAGGAGGKGAGSTGKTGTVGTQGSARGGALTNTQTDLLISGCTVCGNRAPFDGGLFISDRDSAYPSMVNSIVVGNTGGAGGDVGGAGYRGRDNLVGGTAQEAGLQTDANGVPVLKNNGGLVPTIALLPGSPAINSGKTDSKLDARGFPRPAGYAPDKGAYERQDVPSFITADSPSVIEGNSGTTPLVFTLTLSKASTTKVTLYIQTFQDTALADKDYAPKGRTLVTFAPGQTTQTVTVLIKGDKVVEGDEDFSLRLSSSIGADIATPEVSGIIYNDDRSTTNTSAPGGSAPTS